MRTNRATQLGITVLSVVALVASGASPISALPASLPPTPVLPTLVTPTQPAGIDIDSSGRVYVTGFAGGGGTEVSVYGWTPPTDTGGVPVASYTVIPTPAGPACATTATSCVIGGLANGTPYTFRVTTATTAGLSSLSEPSVAVTPYIPVSLKVKAKKASYRPPRKGTRTLVSFAKKASNATLVVTRSCTNGTALSSAKLCKFRVTRKGKVQVRVKGYKNVRVMISVVAVPKSKAGPAYGPSPTWTRTWRVK